MDVPVSSDIDNKLSRLLNDDLLVLKQKRSLGDRTRNMTWYIFKTGYGTDSQCHATMMGISTEMAIHHISGKSNDRNSIHMKKRVFCLDPWHSHSSPLPRLLPGPSCWSQVGHSGWFPDHPYEGFCHPLKNDNSDVWTKVVRQTVFRRQAQNNYFIWHVPYLTDNKNYRKTP